MKLEAIWQLEGVLETETPMHIGDGGARNRGFRRGEGQPEEQSEIQTAAKAPDGRARIPGSTLKGVVRGGFPENAPSVTKLFGGLEDEENNKQPDRTPRFQGGLVQFLDAYSEETLKWDKLILGRTAIDAVTGAAQDHLLFHMEIVPEGTRFHVRFRGKSFANDRWQDAVTLIDLGMRRFNTGVIRLGAGESSDRGRCKWTLGAVRVMSAAERRKWLQHPEPLDIALSKLEDRKGECTFQNPEATSVGKALPLRLNFDGHPFLVNDPSKTGKKDEHKHAHAARRARDGKLLLPAESFRGVLSHQAERIARTKNKPTDRRKSKRHGSVQDSLTLLFGAAGWGSPITIRDFIEVGRQGKQNPSEPVIQEFLALDRFTGGGADERKFDAEGGWEPILEGALIVDLDRLKREGVLKSALGLLALTLRDLAEGDLAFGWGSGKGYGWATVDTGKTDPVTWVEKQMAGWCDGNVVDWIREWEQEGSKNGLVLSAVSLCSAGEGRPQG